MSSRLTVTPIGTSPAWYNPGEPASGTLVDVDGFRVLVDCGSGVISRYLALDDGAPPPIDAIVITHAHPDHVFDLVPLKYGLIYGPIGWEAPQLWLPPGGHGRLQRLAASFDGGEDFFTESFDVRSYSRHGSASLGPFDLRAVEVPHFIEAFALRLDHAAGSIVFSGDMGPNDAIDPLVRGADLFVCEACAPVGVGNIRDAGHLSPEQAADIAARCDVPRLMLTHVPRERGMQAAVDEAARHFTGEIVPAEPLVPVTVDAGSRRRSS